MKVLLFTDNHDPEGGGAEVAFFRLKKALEKQKGIQVLSLGFGNHKGKNAKSIEDNSNLVQRQLYRTFENKKITKKIKKIIDDFSPDIIHLHNINKHSISIINAIKNYSTVMTCHDIRLINPTLYEKTPLILKPLISLAHKKFISGIKNNVRELILPSPTIEKQLKDKGFSRIKIIPNLLEKIKTKKSTDKNFILFAGGLHKMKGYNLLVDAFLKAKTDKKLLIAGEGPENKISNINIIYLGRVKLNKYYESASFVIVPSIVPEQFGFVTAEAMQYGKAVIGTNRGSTPWLIDNNKTGLIVEPEVENLKIAIEKLSADLNLSRKYGGAGKQRINKLINNNKIIEQTIKVYNENKISFRRK